jgi:hypothetical protein
MHTERKRERGERGGREERVKGGKGEREREREREAVNNRTKQLHKIEMLKAWWWW